MKRLFIALMVSFVVSFCYAQNEYKFKGLEIYPSSNSFGGRFEKEYCSEAYTIYWVIGDDGKGFAFKDKINNIKYAFVEYHRESKNENGTAFTTIFLEDVDNPKIKGKLHITHNGNSNYYGASEVSFVVNGFHYIFYYPCANFYLFN